ncbi:NAD(P)-dependent dehydrogenase, short-chain alcohol dehydrogenase family [Chitinophaga costaii]|uniref:NAD(P)-dependent dehydrogenase, short-chain alcohol dehydrogenase family n=1 Tax=Chitinophaga costaii TaxID=1335309 RepID=A0A1C4BB22_9BACT|nr:SDR family oxidoreductase [Chitinophaga costaii]PUZ27681.1 KR domain-containing protein [Chitinophaga costaii]SCC04043.1 NAD(P)-dependent dehydrogenase, short-chain alcohol dehydrogenase family [Chitinophaga costaii]
MDKIKQKKSPKVGVVFGGSYGIGEATAKLLMEGGTKVTIVGRNAERLAAAAMRINGNVQIAVADALDRNAVLKVFEATGPVDTVVICVAGVMAIGLFKELDLNLLRTSLEEKTIAQLQVAQVAAQYMKPNGSITFVTAGSAGAAISTAAGPGAVSGALECLIPTLALELAPVRVNAVSPGVIDTALWDFIPDETRKSFLSNHAANLAVGRIGQAIDVAEVIELVTRCGFITGSIYQVNGGSHLTT